MALDERTAITFTPGVPPIWSRLVRSYEEPNLCQGPGPWERFKAAANVFIGSLVLVVAACVLAVGVSQKIKARHTAKQSPVGYQQQSFVPNERVPGAPTRRLPTSRGKK